MATLKFGEFLFDNTHYRLTHRGVSVALRPKALKLLRLLIENRERVVPKSEILESVWGDTYARDHLLFQLVGELRKAPFQADFVRTQPNEGYQWNVATRVMPDRVVAASRIAASVVIGLILLLMSTSFDQRSETTAVRGQLPAYSAFSKGVIALERGQGQRAAEWFRFALKENPDSVEASLFLAETLLQLNKPEESLQHLNKLLQKRDLGPYNRMTATDLLSRVRQGQGRLDEALRYAQASSEVEVIAQCSVEAVEQRLEWLQGELGVSDKVASSVTNSRHHLVTSPRHAADQKRYDSQCDQLKQDTDETTYCEPSEQEVEEYYATVRQSIMGDIS